MTTEEAIVNSGSNPLTQAQRQMLKDLSDVQAGKDYAVTNRRLEAYIETLHDMYPEKFHTPGSLKHRKFYDQPASRSVEHAAYLRPLSESPYMLAKAA